MHCWLAFGEHEAFKRDMKRARILILAEGKPTIPLRLYPADSRAIALRRSLIGRLQMVGGKGLGEHDDIYNLGQQISMAEVFQTDLVDFFLYAVNYLFPFSPDELGFVHVSRSAG